MKYEFMHHSELKPEKHYAVPLVVRLINQKFALAYWTGTEFYDYNNNQKISYAVVRQVMLLEGEDATPREMPQMAMPFNNNSTLPVQQPQGKGGLFNFSANEHPRSTTRSSESTGNEDIADDLPF